MWSELLLALYASEWRGGLAGQHACIRQYLASKHYEFGYATREHPPTAHEQLEAKLALRDWLQGKVTPQQARDLLESLDS